MNRIVIARRLHLQTMKLIIKFRQKSVKKFRVLRVESLYILGFFIKIAVKSHNRNCNQLHFIKLQNFSLLIKLYQKIRKSAPKKEGSITYLP